MEKFIKREKFIAKVPFQNILFVLKADFLGGFVPVSKKNQGKPREKHQIVFGDLTEFCPSTASSDESG